MDGYMTNKVPNFLIVGGAKCGTTSLHHYLRQHPQVFMPDNKEPLFMVSAIYEKLSRKDPRHKIVETILPPSFKDYLNLFKQAKNQKARGEASSPYLYYYQTAIPKIKEYLGDVKIIIILRNPVERAFSSYKHLLKYGCENDSFENLLEREEERRGENWDILNFPKALGFYHNQVKAYMDNFTNVKVCLLDDLKNRHAELLEEIYKFLNIDTSIVPNTEIIFNQSIISRFGFLHYLLFKENIVRNIARLMLGKIISEDKISQIGYYLRGKNRIKMKPGTREFLKRLYRPDILKLQNLIGRDLSHWL